MSQRTERLDELLRQEIGAMLEREIADPRIGFATVTEVETTPDLRHARVWISVIGGSGERDATIAGLEHAMVFVRRALGTRLRLRRIPELHVRLDDSIERGTRVLRLLDSLEAGVEPDDASGGESLPTPSRATPPESTGFGAAAAEFAAAREQERDRDRAAAARVARSGRNARRRRQTGR
jgi:ribosome-binding factor A